MGENDYRVKTVLFSKKFLFQVVQVQKNAPNHDSNQHNINLPNSFRINIKGIEDKIKTKTSTLEINMIQLQHHLEAVAAVMFSRNVPIYDTLYV